MVKPETFYSSTSGTGEVRCPFFKGHGRNEIVCEGLVDRSSIILRYQSTGDKEMQSTLYCKGLYSYCEIYNMLMRAKYDEGDDVR